MHNFIDQILLKKNSLIYQSGQKSFDIFLLDFKMGGSSLNTLKLYL